MNLKEDYLYIDNKVNIAKNENEIQHNKADLSKNKEDIESLKKQVATNKRMVYILLVMAISIAIIIFVNGMMVHYQTGLDEYENKVFQGDIQVGNLEI